MEKSKKVLDEELLMKKLKEYEGNPTIAIRNEIIEISYPLVEYVVVGRLSNLKIEKNELISIGSFGLINAVETYDVDYGTGFEYYATICILNGIKSKLNTVTYSKMKSYNYPILLAIEKIERFTGIKLSKNLSELDAILEEITFLNDQLKEKVKTYLLTMNCRYNEHNVQGTYEIEDSSIKNVLIEKMGEYLESLSEREREVLKYKYGYYGILPTDDDMGKFFGCTRANIYIIEKKALKKLRKEMNSRL